MLASLITGYLLDLLIGDPYWMPHPVRLIGTAISKGERIIRKAFPKTPKGEYWGGVTLTILITGFSFLLPLAVLTAAGMLSPILRWLVESILIFQILATKSLKTESMKVYYPLQQGDLPGARKAVSMIVGRDTERLTSEQVAKAAVETIAENTSDGVIAPLFFITLGGAPIGLFYKAINTLDSMIGYKNEKYLSFGRFAAKLDDAANYLPARLSAWLMIAASALCGFDAKHAARIYRRDKRNHTSPNSAHTEAVCAGALHVQLAGDNYYFGRLVHKPTIGDNDRPVETEDIRRANHLLYGTSLLGLALSAIVITLVTILF